MSSPHFAAVATRPSAPSGSAWRRALGLFLSLFLVAGSLVALTAPAAHAAEGDVIVTNYGFTKTEFADGSSQDVKIDFKVDGKAEPTVKFTVPMPDGVAGENRTITLLDPDGNPNGTCVVTSTEMTCTLDDDYVKANPYDVSGSVTFAAHTTFKNRDKEQHTIDWGDVQQDVTVDANPNWCYENCQLHGQSAYKNGSYNNDDDTIVWTVRIKAPAEGMPAGQNVVVTDDFDPALYDYITDGYPRVYEGRSQYKDSWDRQQVRFAQRTDGVTVSNDGKTVSFTTKAGKTASEVTGDEQPLEGSYYYVQFKMKAKDEGKAKEYHNDAHYTIDGTESEPVSGSAVRYDYSGTAVGKNFGKFQVTKELSGDTTLDPTFTVNYTYTLDGVTKDGSFTIRNGNTWTSGEFFRGTVVKFTEVKPTDPSNVTWADPQLVDENGNPVGEMIIGQEPSLAGQLTKLTLKNNATLKKAPFQAKKKLTVTDPVEGGKLTPPTEYTLNYSYPADKAKGIQEGSGTLTLKSDGTIAKSGDLPVGAVLTLTEAGPTSVPGGTWQPVEISPKTITIGAENQATVEVTNVLKRDLGGFDVSKSISGDGKETIDPDAEYTIHYSYPADEELGFPAGAGTFTVKAGSKAGVDGLPAGASVTLDEIVPANPSDKSWTPTWADGTPGDEKGPTFVIVKDQTANYSLDNALNFNTGTFNLKKVIEDKGEGDNKVSNIPEDAQFTVEWTAVLPETYSGDAPTTGTVTLDAQGTVVDGPELPAGAKVTFKEAAPTAVPGATWGQESFSPSEITIGDEQGNSTAVTLTNSISKDLGSISVSKKVEGSGKDLVSGDTEFTLDYSYEAVPGSTAVDNHVVKVKADGTPTVINDLPTGAEVTFSEQDPAAIPGGHWQPVNFPNGATVVVGKDTTAEFSVVNTIDLGAGQFSIAKDLTGTGKDLVDPDLVYTVEYSYPKGVGFEAGSGRLEVKADGTVVDSPQLPYGAKVTLSEVPPDKTEGVSWELPQFSQQEVTIGDETTVAVKLTNEATLDFGQFSIAKDVTGTGKDLIDPDQTYTVDYSYPAGTGFEAGSGALEVKADGTVVDSPKLPFGAEVTLSEKAPAKVEGTTWQEPKLSQDKVTIGDETTVAVKLTNEATLDLGQFSIAKQVTGSGKNLVGKDDTYTVKYSYPAGPGFKAGSGTLTVKADGTPVESDQLPYGAVVTLSEKAPAKVEGATWQEPKFSQDQVTIGDETTVAVKLTNELDVIPPTPSSPAVTTVAPSTHHPSTPLSNTGAKVGGILALAVVVIGAGVIALTASHRRRHG